MLLHILSVSGQDKLSTQTSALNNIGMLKDGNLIKTSKDFPQTAGSNLYEEYFVGPYSERSESVSALTMSHLYHNVQDGLGLGPGDCRDDRSRIDQCQLVDLCDLNRKSTLGDISPSS